MRQSIPLLIPIENQVRELDPKILLAVIAASRNIPSYIGYRTEMDIMISTLPRGIYLAKSFTQRSDKMFRILSKLGHLICAWDEEALVHYPPDIYYTRRLSPIALSYISNIFAWGKENEELFRSYAQLPENIPIYRCGNPRLDLLRTEFESFYEDEITHIKQQYGNFVLINTNFGNVNAHLPALNLFSSRDSDGNYLNTGRGAIGMERSYAEGRAKLKQTLFDSFLSLIPVIADSFKDTNIIIRPHPIENREPYEYLASRQSNIQVVQRGNVIPWIRAANSVIHSGCTTGIEAYLTGKPAIAYVPVSDDRFGYDAHLPNQLSHCCETASEVITLLQRYMQGNPPALTSTLINEYIEFSKDTLCATNIVQRLEAIRNDYSTKPRTREQAVGWFLANKRRLIKRIKSQSPRSKYHRSFQEVRFPTLSEESLREKVSKFANIVHLKNPPAIKQVSSHIFLVQ